jgi:hypothetical protein
MPDVAARPLQVQSTEATKTLFALMSGPGLAYSPIPDPNGPAPDVLVVPMHGSEFPLAGLTDRASPEVWRRIAAGKTLLVFDNATEGHAYNPDRSKALHGFLAEQQISPRSVAFVTQDRAHETAYRAHAVSAGYAETYGVLNYDFFIKNLISQYESTGPETFARRLAAFRSRSQRRKRRYISLNFTPRPIKVLFLMKLIEDGLWDRGFISFGGFAPEGSGKATQPSVVMGRIRALSITGPVTEGQSAGFQSLVEAGPRYLSGLQAKLDRGKRKKPPVLDEDLPEHENSWFTVVTETEIDGPWRVTEKPLKSLLGFHPTIILGNTGALDLLRGFGFRTFDGYFDESYDTEPDKRRRFKHVYDEVARLARADEAELRRLEDAYSEVLVHNAEWGLTRLPGLYRDQIDPAFLAEISALMARSA